MKRIDIASVMNSTVGIAHPAQIEGRVTAMLQRGTNRTGAGLRAYAVTAVAALCLAPLCTLRVIAQQAPQPAKTTKSAPQVLTKPVHILSAQHAAHIATSVRTAPLRRTAQSHSKLAAPIAAVKTAKQAAQTENFPDVPKSHWAYQAVLELKQKGILIGYPPGR